MTTPSPGKRSRPHSVSSQGRLAGPGRIAGLWLGLAGLCVAPQALAQSQTPNLDTLPPNAKPGSCYARVFIPAKTRQVAKRVLVKEASEEIAVKPAEYRWVDKEIEIETAAERIEVTPARFEIQKRTVVIEPERREITVEPAEYETISARELVRQEYTTWRRKVDPKTGEIMRLVTVPAEYRSVERKIVKKPARLVTKIIPARTLDVDVKVMVQRPRRRVIAIPPVMKKIRVQELVSPARTERKKTPAVYKTVLETVKAEEGRLEWRPVLCESGVEPEMVREIQSALKQKGYDPGPVDGLFGRRTRAALIKFQRAKGLAEGGVLMETLEALGVRVSA